jgi:hypothetical protein
MKAVLELLAASTISVGMVLGGVILTSAALSHDEEPQRFTGLDTDHLWTSEPVRIDRDAQTFERLPPRYSNTVAVIKPKPAKNAIASSPSHEAFLPSAEGIDLVYTGAVEGQRTPPQAPTLSPEHLSWCAERYRSYDPVDNTYRSFGGEIRDCASPYVAGTAQAADDGRATVVSVSHDDAGTNVYPVAEDKIRACKALFRSYRVEDNSYQPYGGGMRRKCELVSF